MEFTCFELDNFIYLPLLNTNWYLGVIHILRYHQGGGRFRNDYANQMPNLITGGGGGLKQTKSDYVICARSLIEGTYSIYFASFAIKIDSQGIAPR